MPRENQGDDRSPFRRRYFRIYIALKPPRTYVTARVGGGILFNRFEQCRKIPLNMPIVYLRKDQAQLERPEFNFWNSIETIGHGYHTLFGYIVNFNGTDSCVLGVVRFEDFMGGGLATQMLDLYVFLGDRFLRRERFANSRSSALQTIFINYVFEFNVRHFPCSKSFVLLIHRNQLNYIN